MLFRSARGGGRGEAGGPQRLGGRRGRCGARCSAAGAGRRGDLRSPRRSRSEEHTSELQSHHDISYAVFCLKKKKKKKKKKKNNKKKKKKKKYFFFFFNDTATTEIYTCRHTLSLHDALPILSRVKVTVFVSPGASSTFSKPFTLDKIGRAHV